MFSKFQIAVALTAVVTVSACTVDPSSQARVTEPEVSADFVSTAVSCTNSLYSSYKRSAGDYSTLRSDPVVDLFGVLQKATTAAARKQAALDILARLDVIRSTGLSKSSVDGGKAAVAAIGCGGLGTPPTDAQMASAMDLSANGGVFKMVGGASDLSTTAAVAAAAVPAWGAEPYIADASKSVAQRAGTWATAFPNDRVLLYAYRTATMTGYEGIPLDPASVVFDMATAPLVDPVQNTVDIFVCAGDVDSRIQSKQFVMSPWTPRYCPTQVVSAPDASQESLGSRMLAWLSPKPAYAALLGTTVGGVRSGWSPKGLVKVDRSLLAIELTEALKDVSLKAGTFDVKVKAYARGTNGQLPTGDIKIVVSVAGNNGVGSDGTIAPSAPGFTDDNGLVTIKYTTGKTGSYTLRIDGYFIGQAIPVTIFTQPFNVRP